jgi:hypothetical protein
MATSSILGGERAWTKSSGHDVDALGPSDTSDSGSDIQGERSMSTTPDNPGELGSLVADGQSDTDASGTGERASATGSDPVDGADILPDRITTDDSLAADDSQDDLSQVNAIASDEDDDDDGQDTAQQEPPARDAERRGPQRVGTARKRQSASKERPR